MLELMYITNSLDVAKIADQAGVDRIWIDLEKLGKESRQKSCDSVKSNHTIEDIGIIKPKLKRAKLQVRINPINEKSEAEINEVIENGADIVMLPFYKTVEEVKEFVRLVAGRAMVVLLLETKEANECIDNTLLISGVDEIHIGLNDLHLSYNKDFMFELLTDGTVESICQKIKAKGKHYGFGGIAKLGQGMLPAERIVAEHYRLKSTRAILSRSFCNINQCKDMFEIKEIFCEEILKLKNFESQLCNKSKEYFELNRQEVKRKVEEISMYLKNQK